jgi:spermidine synthase
MAHPSRAPVGGGSSTRLRSESQNERTGAAKELQPAGLRIAVLSGILFLSGTGALIFETLWLRLSGLAFGNSVWSAALILSSFMAGLALGNAIAASSKVRRWRPLQIYALLELLVALFGCTIVFVLPLLGTLLRPLWQTIWNDQAILLGLRFVVSFLVLLVPTTAMGLTLPVLIEDPILRRTRFGRAIGFLYGFNTLGAVAGAVLGEAFLIAAFGLLGTALVAGLAVCLAAGTALLVAQLCELRSPESEVANSPRDESAVADLCHVETADMSALSKFPLRLRAPYRLPWRLLLVSFGTGCVLLSLEVIWFRFLRLYVAPSSTAFAIMLATVLAAIGLGSVTAGAIRRRSGESDHLLPVFLLLAALSVPLAYIFFPGESVRTAAGPYNLAAWPQIAVLTLALVFPVAFLSGILFPSIVVGVQASVRDRMNSTGVTTLFNTTGAAIGPLLASFIVLPHLGYQWGLLLCAASYALLALVASQRSTWSVRKPIGLAVAGLSVGLVLTFALFPYHRDQAHFAHARRPYDTDEYGHLREHLVKGLEGTADTYQLLRHDLFGEPYRYRLLTNSFSMAGTGAGSERYMRLFAYLPLTFRPASTDVLLICYGCGVTADAFLHGPDVKRLDAVDISKEVFSLADFYTGINYSNALRDPRVHAVVQDGRFFLQASPRQYDIISGEPPPPKVAGSVNLYTEEFFKLVNSRLKEGGIATFWLPLNLLKVDEGKAILRGFRNAFSNASVWASADEQWIMMGIKGPGTRVNEQDVTRLWSNPSTGADLKRIGMEKPQQLGALFVMDGEEIDRLTQGVAPLTDFYPKRLSDEKCDEQASQRFALHYLEAPSAIRRFLASPLIHQIWPESLKNSIDFFFLVREARYVSGVVGGGNKWAELDLYLRHSNLETPVLEVFGSDQFRMAIAEKVERRSSEPSAEIIPDLIAGALARRDINEAIRLLESKNDRGFANRTDLSLLSYLYCLNGNVERAEALVAENAGAIKQDRSAEWLWATLQTDFGFRFPQ